MGGEVAFVVPLPPRALRVNRARGAHWATRQRAAGPYSHAVYLAYLRAYPGGPPPAPRWETARGEFIWCHAGVAPDVDNVAGSLKVLIDAICCAPRHAGQDRWYLGLLADDRGLVPTFGREKVAHRADEGIRVRLLGGEK